MELIGPISQSFISQRTRLHYADWGNTQAPPLILQHGGRDHCRSWDWLAEELRHDWHVICPDLRGHGDSEWTSTGYYPMTSYVYDFTQLVHQLELAPVTIVAHSLGGNIATRYTGMYPENVRKLVTIEGLGLSPKVQATMAETPWYERTKQWFDAKRDSASRLPKRYDTFEDALNRMHEANSYLSRPQAEHLTRHGAIRNEDGTWSWKFDPHLHAWPPDDLSQSQIEELWGRIACPTLMIYGNDSWASNPMKDGRIQYFGDNVRVSAYDRAGHWVHHDRFEDFTAEVRGFIG